MSFSWVIFHLVFTVFCLFFLVSLVTDWIVYGIVKIFNGSLELV